jgi:hypothetical protein
MKALSINQVEALRDRLTVGYAGEAADDAFVDKVNESIHISQLCKCAIVCGWDLESFADMLGEVLYDIPRTGEHPTQAMVLAKATIDYGLDPNLFTEFDT